MVYGCAYRRMFSGGGLAIPVDKLRNIGIIAHIDAGKTTTTERILYHGGKIAVQGDVDTGSTTTDFLPDERARGITIQSACTNVMWNDCRVNIIDTPGHVDFTVEVERALRVLDGAVVVLDGMHGVQAQTTTVWRQADRYAIPRIVFVNKLDRPGANADTAIASIHDKLGCTPLVLQHAITTTDEYIIQKVVDLVTMEAITWTGEYGEDAHRVPLDRTHANYEEIMQKRMRLFEILSDDDDVIAEWFLDDCSGDSVSLEHIHAVIRRMTLNGTAVPVLVGSAFVNIGIQPLLDGIVAYLPKPNDDVTVKRQVAYIADNHNAKRHRARHHSDDDASNKIHTIEPIPNGPLIILAFKVVHDMRFGAIVYGRVYSGTLEANKSLRNARTRKTVRPVKLIDANGEDGDESRCVTPGAIVAMIGCRDTQTGDTLLDKSPKQWYILPTIRIPAPVYFHGVEASSPADAQKLRQALSSIVQEDPSVEVAVDSETGQTLVKGLGELHLQIITSRLVNYFKVKVDIGRMMIAYRESVTGVASYEEPYYNEIGGRTQAALVKVRVSPANADDDNDYSSIIPLSSDNVLVIDANFAVQMEAAGLTLSDDEWIGIREGVETALYRGPKLGYPVQNVCVCIYGFGHNADTTQASFRSATLKAMQVAMADASPCILEPCMRVEVTVDPQYTSVVIGDIPSRRRGRVVNTEYMHHGMACIRAIIPLSTCREFATAIRGQTKGSAALTMEFYEYEVVDQKFVSET